MTLLPCLQYLICKRGKSSSEHLRRDVSSWAAGTYLVSQGHDSGGDSKRRGGQDMTLRAPLHLFLGVSGGNGSLHDHGLFLCFAIQTRC